MHYPLHVGYVRLLYALPFTLLYLEEAGRILQLRILQGWRTCAVRWAAPTLRCACYAGPASLISRRNICAVLFASCYAHAVGRCQLELGLSR